MRFGVVLVPDGRGLRPRLLMDVDDRVPRSFCRGSISHAWCCDVTYTIRVKSQLHLTHPLAELANGGVERTTRFFCPSMGRLDFSSCTAKVAVRLVDGLETLIDRGGKPMENGLSVLHDDAEALSERCRRSIASYERV